MSGDGDGDMSGDGDGDGDGDGSGDGDGDGDGDTCVGPIGFTTMGCEFRVSTLRQAATQFGLIVENPSDVQAMITIELGGDLVGQHAAPQGTTRIELPTIASISDIAEVTKLAPDANYRVTSSGPVSIVAYSDIDADGDLTREADVRLLPMHTWSEAYFMIGWGTGNRGWYAALAANDPTQIQSVPSSVGDQVVAGVGVQVNGTANVGINLETLLLVTAIVGVDLTGTRITSNVPFIVYAGHDYATLGGWGNNGRLRQQLIGTQWLGDEYVVAPPASANPNVPRTHRVRVMAVEAGTDITFEPDIGLDTSLMLAGTFIETPVSNQPLYITSSKPVLVAQYTTPGKMLIAVPVAHFATDHVVSVSSDWGSPNVAVVAPNDAVVQLDGDFVTDWFTIGQSGFKAAYVPLTFGGAMRLLSSTEPAFATVTTANAGIWHSTGY
jgi:hypothetical protein